MNRHPGVAVAGLLCVVVALLTGGETAAAGGSGAVHARPTVDGWRVGAAAESVSPRPYVAADDAAEFPLCNTAIFNGPRHFDDEEPYVDLNGNGRYDLVVDPSDPSKTMSEPYCDANANGRRDTLYDSGGVAQPVVAVHDEIDARAIAVEGPASHVALIAEVTTQGLFDTVTEAVRSKVVADVPALATAGITVGATHNESSPDELGLYGAPDTGQSVGATSGIDDYYSTFLVNQTAKAVEEAYASLRPGNLQVLETRVPTNIHQNLSTTFTTTLNDGTPVAVDPDIRVLHATASDGSTVFTLLNQADHNQEIGHGPNTGVVSGDWPGYFDRRVEATLGGMAAFMPADLGSMEDPVTVPKVGGGEGTFEQARATGETIADAVLASLSTPSTAQDVTVGTVSTTRSVYDTPLENNLFKAAEVAGLFGDRPSYTAGQASGQTGTDLRTEVSLIDLGPDLQLVTWPGEAFPGLALGSRWGIEDASCPARPYDVPPLWSAHARFRFQMGLGGDMLGYLEPAWGWATDPGVIADTCFTDPQTGLDPAGHKHKLETESVGPQSAADAASHLTALLDADSPDAAATIRHARFLDADGKATRDGTQAVALWVAPSDTTPALVPGQGTIVALPGITGFGTTPVSLHGKPIDANGRLVAVGDLQTRGFAVLSDGGAVTHRYYADVYAALGATSPGAPARGMSSPAPPPTRDAGSGPVGLGADPAPTGATSISELDLAATGGSPVVPLVALSLVAVGALVRRRRLPPG